MKKNSLLFFLFYFCGVEFANATFQMLPSAFPDSLVKQRVCYKDPGIVGQNIFWDFSMLQILDENYSVVHFFTDSIACSVICGKEHNTRYYYSLGHDTIYNIGYEDENTIIHYSAPEVVGLIQMQYGGQVQSCFAGSGCYGHLLPMYIEGYTNLIADAKGTMELPDGRHDNVLRTHSLREYTVSGIDTTPIAVDSYKWYTTESAYPVFESLIATSIVTDSLGNQLTDTVLQTSFYYFSPIQNTTSIPNQNSDIPEELSVLSVFADASFLPNPVESELQVSYTLSRDAMIGYSVHSASGLPILTVPTVRQPAGEHTDLISMSACYRGAYTLYVYVDGYVLQEVIIKK